MEKSRYSESAERILESKYVVALTGAGISVESGIPDFRSSSGLWSRYDPEEYGHIDSFRKDPAKVWRMILEIKELLDRAEPNKAHLGLAEMEKEGLLKTVITQNIDSLHQKAGSTSVVEYHGHARTLRCDLCGHLYFPENINLDKLPPRCYCSGPIRPNFVFFGEPIPGEAQQRSMEAALMCDLLLVIGTSATVAPASYIPFIAKQKGAFIIEINPVPSSITYQLSDIYIPEHAGTAIPRIVESLKSSKYEGKK